MYVQRMCEGKDLAPTFLQLATMNYHGIPKFAHRKNQTTLCNVPIPLQHFCAKVLWFWLCHCKLLLTHLPIWNEDLLFGECKVQVCAENGNVLWCRSCGC